MKQSSVALLSLGRLSAFGGDDGGGSPSAGPAAEVPENLAENAVETVSEDPDDLPDLGANAEAKFGRAALASGATVTGLTAVSMATWRECRSVGHAGSFPAWQSGMQHGRSGGRPLILLQHHSRPRASACRHDGSAG